MPKLSPEQKLIRVWWLQAVLGLTLVAISYAFVSLAIDSGSLVEYAIGLIFFVWAVKELVKAVRQLFGK